MQRTLLVVLVVSIAIFSGMQSPTAEAVQPQDGITAESMGARIAQIEGARYAFGTQAERTKLGEVAGYIHTQLDTLGLSVEEDPVTYSGQTFPNVIGVLPGTVCPDTSLIVGAHYDTVGGSPGADDNGSGVAAMLEIARVLSSDPFQPSIEFVGFSFEEQGLVGSQQMATQASAAGEDIAGVIILDMIGYTCSEPGCQSYPAGPLPPEAPNDGTFVAALGNSASAPLLDDFLQASAAAVPDLPVLRVSEQADCEVPVPPAYCGFLQLGSDQRPFWQNEYQALLLVDTAGYRNPNYHHPSDTLTTLDLSFAADVANAALASVVAAATADHDGDGLVDICGGPVGGVAELPEVASVPRETSSSLGVSAVAVVAVAAPVAAGVVVLVATAAWCARRRWLT